MFYIIQVLQPNSRLWQSTAVTFDTLFSSELCRHPTRDEFGRNQWLLERILLQLATWEELRASWRSSSEGQWCAYRRCFAFLYATRCRREEKAREKEGWACLACGGIVECNCGCVFGGRSSTTTLVQSAFCVLWSAHWSILTFFAVVASTVMMSTTGWLSVMPHASRVNPHHLLQRRAIVRVGVVTGQRKSRQQGAPCQSTILQSHARLFSGCSTTTEC